MSAFAMGMPMSEFFGGGIANAHDFNIEYKIFASERMISVELDLFSGDFNHAEQKHFSVRARGLELIAFLELLGIGKFFTGNLNNQLLVLNAVRILGGHFNFALVAYRKEGHRLFKAGNDLAAAFKIGKRNILIAGSINHFTGGIGQSIVEGNDAGLS